MSIRLQVVLEEREMEQVRRAARAEMMTVSAWVRRVLRRAYTARDESQLAPRITLLRTAMRYEHPTADIDTLNAQIRAGYLQAPPK